MRPEIERDLNPGDGLVAASLSKRRVGPPEDNCRLFVHWRALGALELVAITAVHNRKIVSAIVVAMLICGLSSRVHLTTERRPSSLSRSQEREWTG